MKFPGTDSRDHHMPAGDSIIPGHFPRVGGAAQHDGPFTRRNIADRVVSQSGFDATGDLGKGPPPSVASLGALGD
ncbi:MAG: hypothetical protein AAFP90_13640 [Planctomycetota bacterium]